MTTSSPSCPRLSRASTSFLQDLQQARRGYPEHDAVETAQRPKVALIAVAGCDLAGDLGALFKVAADHQISRGCAGAVGLQIGPVASIEVSDEPGAPLAGRRLGIEQRLHFGTPLVALVGAAEAAQVMQAAKDFGKPRETSVEGRRDLGGGRRARGLTRDPAGH